MGSSPASEPALRPLRALRYDQSRVRLGDVVVPPYDVSTRLAGLVYADDPAWKGRRI